MGPDLRDERSREGLGRTGPAGTQQHLGGVTNETGQPGTDGPDQPPPPGDPQAGWHRAPEGYRLRTKRAGQARPATTPRNGRDHHRWGSRLRWARIPHRDLAGGVGSGLVDQRRQRHRCISAMLAETLLPVRGPWATGGIAPGGGAPGRCDPGDDDGDGTAAGIRTDVLGPTGPPSVPSVP